MSDERGYSELDQMMPYEDWQDDYDDMWSMAERRITQMSTTHLAQLDDDLHRFFAAFANRDSRRSAYYLRAAFSPDGDDFDIWLLDVVRRVKQALAGIHNAPMMTPVPYPYP